MSYQNFSKQFGVEVNNIAVQKSKGRLPDKFFSGKRGRDRRIDEKPILRRKAFQQKIILENQQLYYYLTDTMSKKKMAALISDKYQVKHGGILGFIQGRICKTKENDSVLSYRICRSDWIINKYYRYLLRQKRKTNPDFTFDEDYA